MNPRPLWIGEIVRYRLTVDLPEGGPENISLHDFLPPGLSYLGGATTKFALVGTSVTAAGCSSVTTPVALVTPACVLPTTAVSGGPFNCTTAGADPTFNLGPVTNADRDPDLEYIVLEFNALVCNIPPNQAGVALPNSFRVDVNDVPDSTSPEVWVKLGEPNLTLDKTAAIAPGDGFNPTLVTYTITVKNTGSADAYDVPIIDALVNSGSLSTSTYVGPTIVTGPTPAGVPVAAPCVGNPLPYFVNCPRIPAGSTVTITYTVLVTPLSPPFSDCDAPISNSVQVSWTSLPGTGTAPNPTGSNTPGPSGAIDGERVYPGPSVIVTTYPPRCRWPRVTAEFGDAPDSYKTTLAADGPRHPIPQLGVDPWLGALVDGESDGVPSILANGDDLANQDDEDGVTITGLAPGALATAHVFLNSTASARLDAWVDFNGDGTFDPVAERIFNARALVAGNNNLTFTVPASVNTSALYARFRVTAAGGLPPFGPGGPGEVEDYRLPVATAPPCIGCQPG